MIIFLIDIYIGHLDHVTNVIWNYSPSLALSWSIPHNLLSGINVSYHVLLSDVKGNIIVNDNTTINLMQLQHNVSVVIYCVHCNITAQCCGNVVSPTSHDALYYPTSKYCNTSLVCAYYICL